VKRPRLPRIGACHDALGLWFLEYASKDGLIWRRYYATRAEARAALRLFKGAS